MTKELALTDISEVYLLNGILHDQVVILSEAVFSEEHCVSVPILIRDRTLAQFVKGGVFRRRYSVPLQGFTLLVNHASALRIEDKERIGFFTINRFHAPPGKHALVLETCEGAYAVVSINAFRVVLRDEKNVVGEQTVTRGFFGETLGPIRPTLEQGAGRAPGEAW